MSVETNIHTAVSLRDVIATTARLLKFRADEAELTSLGRGHLMFGLACTWIVGIATQILSLISLVLFLPLLLSYFFLIIQKHLVKKSHGK